MLSKSSTSTNTTISPRPQSTVSEISTDTVVSNKLRRLKIEEYAICKSIKKTSEDFEVDESYESHYVHSKSFFTNLKDSFLAMKNLFEDIKSQSVSKHNSKVIDIEEVKRDVLDLESKIKSTKDYLEIELSSIKGEEKEIIEKLSNTTAAIEKNNRRQRIQTVSYKDLVSSPVRAIMKSPFKSVDVQNFQDFMASSKNYYGGWIPYNHHLFERIWCKYFGEDVELVDEHNLSKNFEPFVDESLQKIKGMVREEIISHYKWYSKYVYLKSKQQKALHEWRTSKNLLKNTGSSNVQGKEHPPESANFERPCKINNDNHENRNIIKLVDETEQMDNLFRDQISREIPRVFNGSISNEDFLFEEKYLHDSVNVGNKTQKTDGTNIPIDIKSVKKKSGFNKPTQQWSNRCSSSKDCPSSVMDVENISKLCVTIFHLLSMFPPPRIASCH